MNKTTIITAAGLLLALAGSVLSGYSNKIQMDDKIKEEVAKAVTKP